MNSAVARFLALVLMGTLIGAAVAADSPPAKPADAKPAEAQPAPAKPVDAKPTPVTAPAEAKAPEAKAVADAENSCIACHQELTEKDQVRFHVTPQNLAGDVHWQKGLRCQDCHGGDPTVFEIKAHQAKGDFRAIKSPADVPQFCGECHANIAYMRHYQPSPRTDQLTEYWTSGHGRRLKATGDPQVATCLSCHGGKHGIRAIASLDSPVYRTKIAQTCAKCHSDEKVMAGRQYHGRPLGHNQYEQWRQSVHGKAMMDKGDLSAATCNNCHGNHGALPPDIGSVANACGACHTKVAKLFSDTVMRHQFEKAGLPGCATCHTSHSIKPPSDQMLGMEGDAVCMKCHADGKHGATAAGAEAARHIRLEFDRLNGLITDARAKLTQAERLGMEVSQPRFDLRKAASAQTNARTMIHTFAMKPIDAALGEGFATIDEITKQADAALYQYTYRRIWLAASLVPILLVLLLLLWYIRALGIPKTNSSHDPPNS